MQKQSNIVALADFCPPPLYSLLVKSLHFSSQVVSGILGVDVSASKGELYHQTNARTINITDKTFTHPKRDIIFEGNTTKRNVDKLMRTLTSIYTSNKNNIKYNKLKNDSFAEAIIVFIQSQKK